MKGRRIFLLLSFLLFAISVSAEPLAHDHHDENHHEEFCVVCHFVEISSIDHFNHLEISDTFRKNLLEEEYSSYFLSHISPYSTRAPPKI
jgi:lipopolysaccharide biosynthesis protein